MLAPLWSELTSWLAINAPRTLEYVRPPGDPARLKTAEEQLGFALNAELVEWWHLHDGSIVPLVPSYELCGVDDTLHRHEIERGGLSPGPRVRLPTRPRRRGPGRHTGRVLHTSLADLLTRMVTALRTGQPMKGARTAPADRGRGRAAGQ